MAKDQPGNGKEQFSWTSETKEAQALRQRIYERLLDKAKKKQGVQTVDVLSNTDNTYTFKRGDTLNNIFRNYFGMNEHTAFFVLVKMVKAGINVDLWNVGDQVSVFKNGILRLVKSGKVVDLSDFLSPQEQKTQPHEVTGITSAPPVAPKPARTPASAPAPAPVPRAPTPAPRAPVPRTPPAPAPALRAAAPARTPAPVPAPRVPAAEPAPTPAPRVAPKEPTVVTTREDDAEEVKPEDPIQRPFAIPSDKLSRASEQRERAEYGAHRPEYLLGTGAITEAPVQQELTDLERMRYPKVNENGYVAILIAGKRGDNDPQGGKLFDSIKQVIIDPKTGNVMVVDIPRDLAVQCPRDRFDRNIHTIVNAVDVYAGRRVFKDVVAEITGQPVTHEVVMDVEKMLADSARLLELLGGKIVVQNPKSQHFWAEYSRNYFPPTSTLTTPQQIEDYIRFRHGYEVKPIYGERHTTYPFPKPTPDERVRKAGSSVDRSDRQNMFLQSLFNNIKGMSPLQMPAMIGFMGDSFGIPKTEIVKFGALYASIQTPRTLQPKYKNYNILRADGTVAKSAISIDPNQVRREIQIHLGPPLVA